jgi:hypothetical protein
MIYRFGPATSVPHGKPELTMGPATDVSRPILLAADSNIQHRPAAHRTALILATAIALKDDKPEPIRPDDAVHSATINTTCNTDSQPVADPGASVVGSKATALYVTEQAGV